MTTTTAKPTAPRQQPVINQPDQPPDWHWQLNGRAVALPDTATPGRRPAQELLPFARSRRRGGSPAHAGTNRDEYHNGK